jgi:hypothetical protein
MPEPPMRAGLILDYSSPRPPGRMRLPSRSRIEIIKEPDGVIVHEWLAAKGQAIFAMVFAALSIGIMILTNFLTAYGGFNRRWAVDGEMILFGTLAGLVLIAGVVVTVMVINNTWRHTYLEAHRDSLILRFTAPLGGERFEWNASEVQEIRLETTTKPNDRNHLGEIEVRIEARPLIKLFTGHTYQDLGKVATAVQQALGIDPARRWHRAPLT